ncbi:MAG: hypothetical protein OEV00_13170 [Acidobacteriota bacterium]|nr:hypothetical protein [Acidobacteriota bacterium]MDH3786263.1 hypothetical protein [Acidobacteriota bacterium]
MQSTVLPLAEEMERRILALTCAESPPQVFRALLEGSRLAAPRAAIFLVRQGQFKGWGSVGFDTTAAEQQRGMTLPAESGLLADVLSAKSPDPIIRETSEGNPDFGQDAAQTRFAIAIRVKDRAIAILYAEQSGNGSSWLPPFLNSLVAIAGIRLELDLLRKKVDLATPKPSTPRAMPTAAPAATPVVAPVPRAASPEPAPTPAPTPVPTAAPTAVPIAAPTAVAEAAPAETSTDPGLEAARRFARLVATDIRLYNEEAVVQGRQAGDLAQRLAEPLARGKETYQRRHGALGATAVELLHEACVQVLASGDASLLPRSCFE